MFYNLKVAPNKFLLTRNGLAAPNQVLTDGELCECYRERTPRGETRTYLLHESEELEVGARYAICKESL